MAVDFNTKNVSATHITVDATESQRKSMIDVVTGDARTCGSIMYNPAKYPYGGRSSNSSFNFDGYDTLRYKCNACLAPPHGCFFVSELSTTNNFNSSDYTSWQAASSRGRCVNDRELLAKNDQFIKQISAIKADATNVTKHCPGQWSDASIDKNLTKSRLLPYCSDNTNFLQQHTARKALYDSSNPSASWPVPAVYRDSAFHLPPATGNSFCPQAGRNPDKNLGAWITWVDHDRQPYEFLPRNTAPVRFKHYPDDITGLNYDPNGPLMVKYYRNYFARRRRTGSATYRRACMSQKQTNTLNDAGTEQFCSAGTFMYDVKSYSEKTLEGVHAGVGRKSCDCMPKKRDNIKHHCNWDGSGGAQMTQLMAFTPRKAGCEKGDRGAVFRPYGYQTCWQCPPGTFSPNQFYWRCKYDKCKVLGIDAQDFGGDSECRHTWYESECGWFGKPVTACMRCSMFGGNWYAETFDETLHKNSFNVKRFQRQRQGTLRPLAGGKYEFGRLPYPAMPRGWGSVKCVQAEPTYFANHTEHERAASDSSDQAYTFTDPLATCLPHSYIHWIPHDYNFHNNIQNVNENQLLVDGNTTRYTKAVRFPGSDLIAHKKVDWRWWLEDDEIALTAENQTKVDDEDILNKSTVFPESEGGTGQPVTDRRSNIMNKFYTDSWAKLWALRFGNNDMNNANFSKPIEDPFSDYPNYSHDDYAAIDRRFPIRARAVCTPCISGWAREGIRLHESNNETLDRNKVTTETLTDAERSASVDSITRLLQDLKQDWQEKYNMDAKEINTIIGTEKHFIGAMLSKTYGQWRTKANFGRARLGKAFTRVPGRMTLYEYMLVCSPCEPGSFSVAGSNEHCTLCPPGYFNDLWAKADRCMPCYKGHYCDGKGSNDGTRMGTLRPKPCPIGQYQPFAGQIKCFPCSTGQSTRQPGTILASNCESGAVMEGYHFNKTLLQNATSERDALDIISKNQATYQTMCPNGTYAPYPRLWQNESTFSSTPYFDITQPSLTKSWTLTNFKCRPCPPGTFTPWSATRECFKCGMLKSNRFCAAWAMHTPEKCGVNEDKSEYGAYITPNRTQCVRCDMSKNEYAPGGGVASECKPCPCETVSVNNATECRKIFDKKEQQVKNVINCTHDKQELNIISLGINLDDAVQIGCIPDSKLRFSSAANVTKCNETCSDHPYPIAKPERTHLLIAVSSSVAVIVLVAAMLTSKPKPKRYDTGVVEADEKALDYTEEEELIPNLAEVVNRNENDETSKESEELPPPYVEQDLNDLNREAEIRKQDIEKSAATFGARLQKFKSAPMSRKRKAFKF